MNLLCALIMAVSGFALAACQASDSMASGPEAAVPPAQPADSGEPLLARTSTPSAGEPVQTTGTARSEVNPLIRVEEGETPFFVEVIQTTAMGGSPPEHPPMPVGQVVFTYDPDGQALFVNPRKASLPTGMRLLIGEMTVLSTPAQSYEQQTIVPYPAALPALFDILSLDEQTGTLRIQVAGEIAELGPGQVRTFKSGGGGGAQTITTVVTNHGRVAEIQELQAGDGLR